MPTPNIFAHSHSALNPFLYADIGPPDGAGALTIASLFGRHGDDPWEEAARLARLPAEAAVASLAAIIAAAPSCPCSLPEASAIAERLVALLPRPEHLARARRVISGPAPLRLPRRWPLERLATCALALGVVVVLVFAWMSPGQCLGHGRAGGVGRAHARSRRARGAAVGRAPSRSFFTESGRHALLMSPRFRSGGTVHAAPPARVSAA